MTRFDSPPGPAANRPSDFSRGYQGAIRYSTSLPSRVCALPNRIPAEKAGGLTRFKRDLKERSVPWKTRAQSLETLLTEHGCLRELGTPPVRLLPTRPNTAGKAGGLTRFERDLKERSVPWKTRAQSLESLLTGSGFLHQRLMLHSTVSPRSR